MRPAHGTVVTTIAAIMLMATTMAGAEPEIEAPWHGSLRKLGRGMANLATCPLELVRTPLDVKAREGLIAALSGGLVEGGLRMIRRGLVGAFEIVTWYAEIPPGFAPLMQPEFGWEHRDWASPNQ
jgi:putative exosortase-associated protein (TIGR04073 family)